MRIRNVGNYALDPSLGAGHERYAREINPCVVEHPDAQMLAR